MQTFGELIFTDKVRAEQAARGAASTCATGYRRLGLGREVRRMAARIHALEAELARHHGATDNQGNTP